MQWSIVQERGFLIKSTLLLTLALTAVLLMFNITIERVTSAGVLSIRPNVEQETIHGIKLSFIVIYHIVAVATMMIGANMMFRNISNKQKRIAFLMIPAGNMEKFLSRLVLVTGGGILMICVSLGLSEVLRMAIIETLYGHNHIGWMLPEVIDNYGKFINNSAHYAYGIMAAIDYDDSTGTVGSPYGLWSAVMSALSSLTFAFALFMFFGILMRKFALVAAFVAYIALVTAASYIDGGVVMTVAGYVGAVLLCIASYNIFTRIQVINNKIANL